MHKDETVTATDASQIGLIEIEIVYAKPNEQVLIGMKLPEGSTIEEAIEASGLLDRFPEVDLSVNKVGIFGRVCTLEQHLKQKDRVEIYRPLHQDPKDSRRQRAAKR